MTEPDRTILITGAGRRVGAHMARTLGAAGWRVVVHYNSSADAAEAVAADIRTAGGEATAIGANLRREDEVASLIAKAVEAVGPVTALVNNASLFEADDIFDMTRASWDDHLEVNLRAPVKLIQDFAAQENGALQGSVINIIDQRVLKLTPQFLSYTTAKAALWTATRTLAQALGPRIRVNAIGPGPTLRNKRQSEEDWRKQNEAMILGRGPTPDDIADAARYLLDASSVTGQMIAVDGGQHLVWRTPDVDGLTE